MGQSRDFEVKLSLPETRKQTFIILFIQIQRMIVQSWIIKATFQQNKTRSWEATRILKNST